MSGSEGLPPMVPIESGRQILWVRRWGAGPRAVLLHGGPGLDHHLLIPLARRLTDFEVWLPDLPGHGRSRQPGRGLPDLSTLIARTAAWLDGLGEPPAVLIGHSLGGWVVRELLRLGEARPRAAVLVAPPVPTGAPARAGQGPAHRSRRPPRRSVRGLREEIVRLSGIEKGEEGWTELQEMLSASRLHPLEDYGALRGQMGRAFAVVSPLAQGRGPLLMLFGAADPLTPRAGIEALGRLTPGAAVEVVEDAGHFPFLERGEAVASSILSFLERRGVLAPGEAAEEG